MFQAVQSIGEHPLQDAELSGPCAYCAADAARRAVWDAYNDLQSGRDFPKESIREFDARFRETWDEMAEFAADQARAAAHGGDDCDEHRTTQDDDE